MKAASALLLAFCFTTSANAAKIVSVGDGDTVRVSDGSGLITVRLACIDAPETSQRSWGAMSTALLKQPHSHRVSSHFEGSDNRPIRAGRRLNCSTTEGM
jgi:endonuclease YncB( thermonuclease family)